MTRYEKFMESINTPEKLIGQIDKSTEIHFNYIFDYDYCKNKPCLVSDDNLLSECRKCQLRYLNEEVE